jgi:S-(hydroxymethyl)glutathione dehydrogenase/alcohol dehydrogenase
MKALVWHGPGTALRVDDVALAEPGEGEVRVRIKAAGVCHSDLSMVDGTLTPPSPLIVGHEAAGVVVETGEHVVLNWAPPCRECWFCTNGEPWLCASLGAATAKRGDFNVTLGLGALAEEVVVPKRALIPIPAELPFPQAALLGCAVLTGFGAVQRTAGVKPGETVAVLGLGGVGLSAVIAAKAAGASTIIAIDRAPEKRDLALAAGATHFALSDDTLSKVVRELTEGRGVDHAFECVGRSATIRAAWRAARRGGHVTVVGMGSKDDLVQLSALDIFHSSRTLRSSVFGSSDPDRDLPALAREVIDGNVNLDALITNTITLDEAPEAFDRMARGEGARSVVLF